MVKDFFWLIKPYQIFENDRYVLVLGPNKVNKGETGTDLAIEELRE